MCKLLKFDGTNHLFFYIAVKLLCKHTRRLHTFTHTHTLSFTPGKCPDYVFSRVANLEQYLSVAGPALLQQPRSLPTLMEAWHSLVPMHIKQRKPQIEVPLLVNSNSSTVIVLFLLYL